MSFRPGRLATLVLVVLSIAPISQAFGSTYEVSVCGLGDGSAGTSSGITVNDYGGSYGYMNTINFCQWDSPSIYSHAFLPSSAYSSWTWDGDGYWYLTAPENTTLEALTMTQSFVGFQSWFTWDLQTPDGGLIDRVSTWSGRRPENGTRTYNVNAPYVRGRFYCAVSSCSGNGTSVTLTNLKAIISDTQAPTLTAAPAGSLLANEPLHGMKGVSFSVRDLGSGVYRVGLLIDGRDEQLTTPDTNGGRCVKPFTYLVPCKPNITSSFEVDTTQIPDGEHEMQVVAYDATEEGRAVSAPSTIMVDNVPDPHAPKIKARRSRIVLKIAPKRLRNMHTIHLRGRLIGGALSRHGVTLLAQAQRKKTGWIVFRQLGVSGRGKFSFDYRFHSTTRPTTYTFRIALAQENRRSAQRTVSNSVKVLVRP